MVIIFVIITFLVCLIIGGMMSTRRSSVLAQLIVWFPSKIGAVMQDRIVFVDDAGRLMPDDDWKKLVQEYFHVDFSFDRTHVQHLK